MVPIALRSLGVEQYGIFVTITTSVTMLLVLDLGIANTLTNLISEAYARNDRTLAAQYFATAFWMITAIVCVLGIFGFVAWPFIPWQRILHLKGFALVEQVSQAFACACAVCLSAMPLALVTRIMAGYQEVHSSNLFASAGSILSLAAVVVVTHLHGDLPSLVAAFAGGPVAGNTACLAWICLWHKPWMKPRLGQFRAVYLTKIFRSGILFFVSQVCALLVLNTDNLIISHYLNPSQVTPYNVTWRLTSYCSLLLWIVTPALVPAYAEAYVQGDWRWMRKTYVRTQRATALFLIVASLALSLTGKSIINAWAGASAVPPTILLDLMCVWMVIFALSVNQSSILCATGRVGKLAIGALLAAPTNLVLSIWWVQRIGVTGVILGTIVCYLLFIVVFQELQVRKMFLGSLIDHALVVAGNLL